MPEVTAEVLKFNWEGTEDKKKKKIFAEHSDFPGR